MSLIRVMTYNVRRCTGLDGRVSPQRIAEIISANKPDLVALQEVDVHRKRTHGIDQPELLAELTGMESVFFARLVEGDEQYGIAVLSRHPLTLIKAASLPTQYIPPRKESTGGIWVRTQINGKAVHFIATHFDHNPAERMTHIRALLGSEWLKNQKIEPPIILCGDLNTTRRSPIYSEVRAVLNDAQEVYGQYKKTWPSFFPIARIDHIFLSKEVRVSEIRAPWSPQIALASDHLPLIADIDL